MKKNLCADTYYNRELCGYIGLLVSADDLLTSLEKQYDAGSAQALKVSQELDGVIADIMLKRVTISQILLADSTFN